MATRRSRSSRYSAKTPFHGGTHTDSEGSSRAIIQEDGGANLVKYKNTPRYGRAYKIQRSQPWIFGIVNSHRIVWTVGGRGNLTPSILLTTTRSSVSVGMYTTARSKAPSGKLKEIACMSGRALPSTPIKLSSLTSASRYMDTYSSSLSNHASC